MFLCKNPHSDTKVRELACGSFIGSAGENLVLLDEVKS